MKLACSCSTLPSRPRPTPVKNTSRVSATPSLFASHNFSMSSECVSLIRMQFLSMATMPRANMMLSANTVRLSYTPSPFELSHRVMRLMGSCSRVASASSM